MGLMNGENSIKGLNWRYATKRYDASKKLSAEQVRLIKEALRLAPNSFGLQAWKFVHVTDPETRKALSAVAWNQPQITEASDFFVLASYVSIDEAFVDKFVKSIAETRGVTAESLDGYKKAIMGSIKGRSPEELENWLARQVYIPLGVALTVAAENRIDASPMEGFNPDEFDKILGLDKLGLKSRVLLAVGFRSPEDAVQNYKKVRLGEDEVFLER